MSHYETKTIPTAIDLPRQADLPVHHRVYWWSESRIIPPCVGSLSIPLSPIISVLGKESRTKQNFSYQQYENFLLKFLDGVRAKNLLNFDSLICRISNSLNRWAIQTTEPARLENSTNYCANEQVPLMKSKYLFYHSENLYQKCYGKNQNFAAPPRPVGNYQHATWYMKKLMLNIHLLFSVAVVLD